MNLWRYAFRQTFARASLALLTVLLIAVGVASLSFVLVVSEHTTRRMTSDVEGVDLVVGAKGSPLQLVMSAVFHWDIPNGNIPYAYREVLKSDRLVRRVIPISLGDNFDGYRVVGTDTSFLERHGLTERDPRVWREPFLALVGTHASRGTGLTVGSRFTSHHGLVGAGVGHDDQPYTVVEVLPETGTVLDRLILTSLESVWLAHEGAVEDEDERLALHSEREVTALLVQYASPLAAALLPRKIMAEGNLIAASPAKELTRLFALLGIGIDVVRVFGGILLLLAALSVWLVFLQTLRQRRYQQAVLRMMGASPWALVGVAVIEVLILASVGSVVGLLMSHAVMAVVGIASPAFGELSIPWWRLSLRELEVVGAVLVLSLLSTLYPLWRIGRVDVADVLASEVQP